MYEHSYFLSKKKKPNSKINKKKNNNYLLIVGSTLLFSFIYFYGIGRNRYITSSDVVVRKTQNEANTTFTLGALLGSGNTGSLEDARYLKTYLLSPQVLADLEKQIPFESLYRRKFPDFLSGLLSNPTRENKYVFYNK